MTAFGEIEVKAFVQAAIDEALKLERAMSQLRTSKRVIVLHYAPVADTARGEAPEIYPYLGSSRLAEVIDRHGADMVLHGHAHHGFPDGKTTAGIPVHNVALPILQSQSPPRFSACLICRAVAFLASCPGNSLNSYCHPDRTQRIKRSDICCSANSTCAAYISMYFWTAHWFILRLLRLFFRTATACI